MKVLLINPPDAKMIQGAIPLELGRDRMGKYPPLGLLYLASVLPDSVEVGVIDAITDDLTVADIEKQVAVWQPDVVGVSVYTFTLLDALDTAAAVRRACPTAHVVFGGFHPTLYPKETIRLPNVDTVVQGEGEETFPVVVWAEDAGIVHQPCGDFSAVPVTNVPFPDRRLVSYQKHQCVIGARGLSTNILSSRGCPFGCRYCYINERRYRMRPIRDICQEIVDCQALGINNFFFVDDLFNLTTERVNEFSQALLRSMAGIRWSFRARVDKVTKEMLDLAKRAGCQRIHYGIESGSQNVLGVVDKRISLEQAEEAVCRTHEAGIEVSCNFMIGLPGEGPKETEQTIRFALKLPTNYLQAAVFTPYPKTPIYEDGVRSGLFPDYWRQFAENPSPSFRTPVWEEYYTAEEIFRKLREFYRRFYMRPRFVWSYLRSRPGIRQAVRNAVTMLKVVGR